MRKLAVWIALVSVGLIFARAGSGLAQEKAEALKLDHFKVYRLNPDEIGSVTLQGQFDREPQKVTVGSRMFFANPVSKNEARILDKNAHLVWYQIRQEKEPERRLEVQNQFGKQKLLLGQPRFLLAPAKKIEQGGGKPPRGLDHFKCYEVLESEPVQKVVSLKDQFGIEQRVRVGRPRFLAVPVEKTYQGETVKIQNKEAHLVVYEIPRKKTPRKVQAADQFGQHDFAVSTSELLCVPSLKKPL
jgi:hypothetical protein